MCPDGCRVRGWAGPGICQTRWVSRSCPLESSLEARSELFKAWLCWSALPRVRDGHGDLGVFAVMLSITAAGVLAEHAHGAELAGWWIVIGSAVCVSLWGWMRSRRRDQREALIKEAVCWLPGAVDPDEYAAQMINCADLAPAPTTLPAPRSAVPGSDSTLDAARLVSGRGSECSALFRYPQSYAGASPLESTSGLNAADLIASLNRLMPG